jgi:putative membrane protein
MALRLALAAFHLLALGIGLGAVWSRGRALSGTLDPLTLRRAFTADSWWGIAALVWISTGLWRVLGSVEKPAGFYFHNSLFLIKMVCFGSIFLLELAPMITLVRWRMQLAKGRAIDTRRARVFGVISLIQTGLLFVMVGLATATARGYGARLP